MIMMYWLIVGLAAVVSAKHLPMDDIPAPGPVAYFDAFPMGSNALYLIWKRPLETNGILTGYNIYYREVIGSELGEERERTPRITDPRETRAKLVGLKPETKYRIDIYATTSKGQGEKMSIEVQTNDKSEKKPDEPNFIWSRLPNVNGKAGVRVTWVPAVEGYPGSHFFVQYRKKGESIWESSPPEENQDSILIQGLELGSLYEMKVVAVDGSFQTSSKIEEIETGGMSDLEFKPLQNPNLFGGDMIGVELDDDRTAVRGQRFRWNIRKELGNRKFEIHIPFFINPDLMQYKDKIEDAIKEYHNKTCIRFIPWNHHSNYMFFYRGNGCYSHVGMIGGRQEVSLSVPGCLDRNTIIHELGHVIGFYHEQNRPDRDDYITIFWDNVQGGMEYQFSKVRKFKIDLLTPFDYDSLMLYGSYFFAKDKTKMTMAAKDGSVLKNILDKPGLSETDVTRINKMYGCIV